MKINIFKTNNEFLEEPTRISVCGDFNLKETKDCKCNQEQYKVVSKEIAIVDFGKYMYDCQRGYANKCNTLIASKRTKPANPDLACQCQC